MKSRRLAVEPLENRTLLAADVVAEIPLPGDANRDGAFNQSDLIQVYEAGKYLTGEKAKWSEGDWNTDGIFDQLDLVFALQRGEYPLAVAAQGRGQEVERPFKGTVTGEATFVFDDSCPIFLRTDSEATGTASHLGRTTMTSQHCTPVGPEITGGEMTLVAANGDELDIEYTGTGPASELVLGEVFVVDVDFKIIDGTGRFEGAQGEGDMTAYVEFPGFDVLVWPASWEWEGTVMY